MNRSLERVVKRLFGRKPELAECETCFNAIMHRNYKVCVLDSLPIPRWDYQCPLLSKRFK